LTLVSWLKEKNLVKFGGGFYCGLIDGLYVFNGFFMSMRSKFTAPGLCPNPPLSLEHRWVP
jgi:hypothetical protein